MSTAQLTPVEFVRVTFATLKDYPPHVCPLSAKPGTCRCAEYWREDEAWGAEQEEDTE